MCKAKNVTLSWLLTLHWMHFTAIPGVRETFLYDATCSSRSATIHTVTAPPVGAIRSVVFLLKDTWGVLSLLSGHMLYLLTRQLPVYLNYLKPEFPV